MAFLMGVGLSLTVGRLLAGCCAGAMTVSPVQSGTYSFFQSLGGDGGRVGDDNEQLLIDADRVHVTESFSRQGKRYVIQYEVVSRRP